jgi:hypothetical protein
LFFACENFPNQIYLVIGPWKFSNKELVVVFLELLVVACFVVNRDLRCKAF